jgi:hypothetical protein
MGRLVPAPARLERIGRVGQRRVPGRRFVGRWPAYYVRAAEPLRLVGFVSGQTVLPELDPGLRAHGAVWPRRQWRVPGRRFVGL